MRRRGRPARAVPARPAGDPPAQTAPGDGIQRMKKQPQIAETPLVPVPADQTAHGKPGPRLAVRALPVAAAGAAVVAAVILTLYVVAPHRTARFAAAPAPVPTAAVAPGVTPSPSPSPSSSRPLSPQASAGAVPPGVAVPPGAPATSAKPGVAVWAVSGESQARRDSGASWY